MDLEKLNEILEDINDDKIVICKVRNNLTRTYKMPSTFTQLRSTLVYDEISGYDFNTTISESESESTSEDESESVSESESEVDTYYKDYDDDDFTVLISHVDETLYASNSTYSNIEIKPNQINLIPSGTYTLTGNTSKHILYTEMEGLNVLWDFQNHTVNHLYYEGELPYNDCLIKSCIESTISFVNNTDSTITTLSSNGTCLLSDDITYTIQCSEDVKIVITGSTESESTVSNGDTIQPLYGNLYYVKDINESESESTTESESISESEDEEESESEEELDPIFTDTDEEFFARMESLYPMVDESESEDDEESEDESESESESEDEDEFPYKDMSAFRIQTTESLKTITFCLLKLTENEDATIDWGDDTTTTLSYSTQQIHTIISHTYTEVGEFIITISNNITEFGFNTNLSRSDSCELLKEVLQLGYAIDTLIPMCFANTDIEEITLPHNLEYIGSDCFYNCRYLKTIYSRPEIAPQCLASDVFGRDSESYCGNLVTDTKTLYIPYDSEYDSYWTSILCNSECCNFTLDYFTYELYYDEDAINDEILESDTPESFELDEDSIESTIYDEELQEFYQRSNDSYSSDEEEE